MQQQYHFEWTCEGSLKDYRVDADGNLYRYEQECMVVHDEWVIPISQ